MCRGRMQAGSGAGFFPCAAPGGTAEKQGSMDKGSEKREAGREWVGN